MLFLNNTATRCFEGAYPVNPILSCDLPSVAEKKKERKNKRKKVCFQEHMTFQSQIQDPDDDGSKTQH